MRKIYLVWGLMLALSFSWAGVPDKGDGENNGFLPNNMRGIQDIAYKEVRIKKFPIAVQCWTFRKFSFFETVDKVKELGLRYLQPYPGQVIGEEMPGVRFSHNMSDEQIKKVRQRLREKGVSLVSYGVVPFDNTEESMNRVFGFVRKMGIGTIVTEPAFDDYSLIDKMVKKYNVFVAIHNHPDPNKYAQPQTVLDHVKDVDERIGACADTGHWMRTGVDPVEALRLLQGRIVDVHLKDLNEFRAKEAHDVPFGQGKANIRDILAELTRQDFGGYLAVEHENQAEVENPSPSIKKGVEYIQSITYYEGYDQILGRSRSGYHKGGWNHYGPGFFELDEKTGILKGHKGMGLFWYSAKKYKDFILDIEFKCAKKDTNSGVFIRVPEIPTSDDYIYHSFEVQIHDAEKGIHKTGAVYDAEAPTADAFKETGEWNHFKIIFKGKNIQIELNGQKILDWDAEPRGKIRDFAAEGYIGLQNHDSRSPVYFRNIYVKEIEQ